MFSLHRSSIKGLGLMLVLFGASIKTSGDTIYFLVSTWPGDENFNHDSYVLPLSQAQDIDYARHLIASGQMGFVDTDRPIVLANCLSGGDGMNRNYVDPTFREWSWHVSQFLKFVQLTIETLDGWPGWTEYQYSNSPPGEPFEIGYWAYTVVRELGPTPLFLSILPDGDNLQFYWSAPGTNYSYTLEGSPSPGGTNWFAIPGGSWPLMTNHWTLPRTNTPAHFFRVRAVAPAPTRTEGSTGSARIAETNSS
jgi:hypothetical protein